MSFVPVATLDQIPVGGCHALRVGRCPLVLFRPSAHEVYAAENRCPHEGYPLSTGRVADGKLTCEWHNWKFRLSDGTNEGGGEDLRTFPLEVHGQEVRVDLREPDAGAVWHAQTRGLEKAFEEGDFGQAARAVERLLQAGHDPLAILGFVVDWAAPRMIWGADHGLAAAADYAVALRKATAPGADGVTGDRVDVLLLDAIHGLVEPNLRRVPLPVVPAAPTVDEATLRARVEAEDREGAEALAQAAPTPQIVPWLLHAATDHFLDYGHAVIFTRATETLLDQVGWSHAPSVLAAVARGLTYGTREDLLPYMRTASQAFEAPFARLEALWTQADGHTPAPVDALVEATLGDDVRRTAAVVTEALERGARPAHVALAIALAAAERMLQFEVAIEHDDGLSDGWLDVTHLLTHAEAVHAALVQHPSPLLLRGLYHGARLVQHVAPLSTARVHDARRCTDPLLEVVRAWRTEDAVPALVHARATGQPVEAALETLAYEARTVLPLFTAHHVKTTTAALRLSAALRVAFPERTDHDRPLWAAARFLATPLVERRLHRRVREARRLVREGKRPESLLGY